MVLDVTRYMNEHPGGQFILKFHVGKDVSKFFYGGYSLESGIKPHTHTNVARKVVNSLVIGRLGKDTKTFQARIQESVDVNKSTKVFIFNLDGSESRWASPASTDLD